MNIILLFLKGIAIGIANVIPGLSAGTIAFMTGVYDKLIEAIGGFPWAKHKRKEYILFLSIIICGAVAGIFAFAKLFIFLLATDISMQYTYFLIMGLIIGSIPLIFKFHNDMKLNFKRLVFAIIPLVIVVLISIINKENQVLYTSEIWYDFLGVFKISVFNLKYNLWMVICGFLSSSAMVLPGLSGSALLVTLGEYDNILKIVDSRLLIEGVFFGIGIILGIISFSKLIKIFLTKYTTQTLYVILGLFVASIFQLYIKLHNHLNLSLTAVIASIFFLALGCVIAYTVGRVQKNYN